MQADQKEQLEESERGLLSLGLLEQRGLWRGGLKLPGRGGSRSESSSVRVRACGCLCPQVCSVPDVHDSDEWSPGPPCSFWLGHDLHTKYSCTASCKSNGRSDRRWESGEVREEPGDGTWG